MKIGLDLDGTLLDCRPRQTALLSVLCRASGLRMDIDRYWCLKRQGCSNRIALLRMGMDAELAGALTSLWEHAIEDMNWLGFDTILPGALETLYRWRMQGHTLHLLSARRNSANARQQLRLLGLDCFTSVEFVNPFDTHAKQPALTKLRPDIYIGDTERDAECSNASGVASILVSSGLREKEYLHRIGYGSIVGLLADVCLPASQTDQ